MHPDTIIVVGGGRWARVIVETLCTILPPRVSILMCSRHGHNALVDWSRRETVTGRVRLVAAFPRECDPASSAAIVANAARDHREAIQGALMAGIPVLVEKPIALSYPEARALAELAQQRKVPLAAAQVFLFARYIQNFTRQAKAAGAINSVNITWTDPSAETRYGEQKQYDAGLPIFCDWLPHVVPILGTIVPGDIGRGEIVGVRRGGAAITLGLQVAGVACVVHLERNADQRRRRVVAKAGAETFTLDFSNEPGTISSRAGTVAGDAEWDKGPRPLASMLNAFLAMVSGGAEDPRLATEQGLQSCRLADEIRPGYNATLARWLAPRIAGFVPDDAETFYAMREMLQADGRLDEAELEDSMRTLKAEYSGTSARRRMDELTGSHEPAQVLRCVLHESRVQPFSRRAPAAERSLKPVNKRP